MYQYILLGNGYAMELVFYEINYRIKILNNKLKPKIVSSSNNNGEQMKKKFIVFLFIKSISKVIRPIIDKTKFTIGYRCIATTSLGL